MLKVLANHVRLHRLVMMKFGLVGVLATVVHLAVALTVQHFTDRPLLANLLGFLTAFGVSLLGHTLWTFRLASGRKRAGLRLFVVSGASFLFSSVVLKTLVTAGFLPAQVSLVISVGVIPVCNYVAAKLWAFAEPPSTDPGRAQA